MSAVRFLALKVAGRELRGGLSRFGVFLACLALGVGVIALVGSTSAGVNEGVRRDARKLLGGDLEVASSFNPVDTEAEVWLAQRGELSRTATMRVMARPENPAPDALPVLAELKAVDATYPLVGEMQLQPAMTLAAALEPRDGVYGCVCDSELLDRLGVQVGGRIELGSIALDVRAVIENEPDRGLSLFSLGPRLMVSFAALDASGLDQPGALVRHRLNMLATPGADVPALAQQFETRFADQAYRVRQAVDASPRVRNFVDRMSTYLTFVGLTAILVGGLGMAGAVRAYLEDRTQAIAAMKCLGADARFILRAYLAQIVALALAGIGLGLALGGVVPYVLAEPLGRLLGVRLVPGLYLGPLATAAGFGLLTALTFSLAPLLGARRTPPARLFRGYADPRGGRLSRGDLALVALAGLLLAGYVVAVTPDRMLALYYAGGAVFAFGVYQAVAWTVRHLAARVRPQGRPRLRLALQGLHAPGNATNAVVFALGLGLTVLAATALTEANLRQELELKLPEVAPAYFFIDIPPNEVQRFRELAGSVPGVTQVRTQPMLRGRIVEINGHPAREEDVPPSHRWALRSDRGLTYLPEPPPNAEIVAGEWWPPDYQGPPLISFAADIAQAFGVGVGDTLTVNVLGREMTMRIANLRNVRWESLAMNFAIIVSPGVLESAPHTWIATVALGPDAPAGAEEQVLRAVSSGLPGVTAIRVREALEGISSILTAINAAVRSVAAVTLAAGLLVLAAAIRAGTRRRFRDATILKVLGATRADVLGSLAMEYAILGVVAGGVAVVLGSVFAWVLVEQVMELDWSLDPLTAVLTVAGGAAATLAVGVWDMRRVLGRSPAQVLRNE